MKKRNLISLVLTLVGFSLFSQALVSPLNGGNPLGTGSLEEALLLPGTSGEQFLVAVEGGKFKAWKSWDGGESFTPAALDLGRTRFARVRTLKLYNRFYKEWLLFFVGQVGAEEHLYALGVNPDGNLALYQDAPFDALSPAGVVGNYALHPGRFSSFILLYLKNDALYYTFLPFDNSGALSGRLSLPGQAVKDFISGVRFFNGSIRHFGFYTVEKGAGNLEYDFFALKDGAVGLASALLYSGAPLTSRDYTLYMDKSGEFHFHYIRDGKLYGRRTQNNLLLDKNAGNPILDENRGQVGGVYGGYFGEALTFYAVESSGFNALYYALNSDGEQVLLENNGYPLNSQSFSRLLFVKGLSAQEPELAGFLTDTGGTPALNLLFTPTESPPGIGVKENIGFPAGVAGDELWRSVAGQLVLVNKQFTESGLDLAVYKLDASGSSLGLSFSVRLADITAAAKVEQVLDIVRVETAEKSLFIGLKDGVISEVPGTGWVRVREAQSLNATYLYTQGGRLYLTRHTPAAAGAGGVQ